MCHAHGQCCEIYDIIMISVKVMIRVVAIIIHWGKEIAIFG